jgi:hypothetical protein
LFCARAPGAVEKGRAKANTHAAAKRGLRVNVFIAENLVQNFRGDMGDVLFLQSSGARLRRRLLRALLYCGVLTAPLY